MSSHLLHYHKLDDSDVRFRKHLKFSSHCQRTRAEIITRQSLENHSKAIAEHVELESDNESTQFSSGESSPASFDLIYTHKNDVSSNFSDALDVFRKFQSCTWGGLCSTPSIETDISNILSIYNFIGQENIYNPEKLNEYLSYQKTIGPAPTTLLCKLHSYRRFIKCMEVQGEGFTP